MRLLNAALSVLLLSQPAEAGIERLQMAFDGARRDYLLYVPERLPDGPRPLVLVLHGGGGSAAEVRRSTGGRFDELAERDGFLVLYPDAVGRIWDTGSGEISERLSPRRDDLGFLTGLIARVSADHVVDRRRIFATGVSRGGQASYMLGCRTKGLIRAIAPVSMTLPLSQERDCASGAPLGFLLVEGTADPVVPYDGGRVTVFGRARDRVRSADDTVAVFLRRNGCTGLSEMRRSGAVARLAGRDCRAPVRLDRVEGGGHGWPGKGAALPRWLAGPMNHDISAPDEIWDFFRRF
ncbi:MAG: hypothetical protein JSR87_04095 [Proteobacteria bacterium]|nr:hypothetical protein [Pseudomonadota bacterium]